MKLILFGVKGDTVVADTELIDELEKIMMEYQEKGCAVLTEDGVDVVLKEPLPKEAFILWPVAGGRMERIEEIRKRLNDTQEEDQDIEYLLEERT